MTIVERQAIGAKHVDLKTLVKVVLKFHRSHGREERMRTISELYKRSGGTAYQHTCSECRFFRDGKRGKCLLYGSNRDWYGRYIACKFINSENDMPDGQMNIFDYV